VSINPTNEAKISLALLQSQLRATHQPDQQWISRTGKFTLFLPRDPGIHSKVVLKRVDSWSSAQAATAYETLRACWVQGQRDGLSHFVGKPHWWGDLPTFICMDWVEGTVLADLISTRVQGQDDDFNTWLLNISAQVGQVIGRYHAAFQESVLEEYLRERQPRGGADRSIRILAGRAAEVAVEARSLGDSGPHNVVVDRSGQVWLIDPPSKLIHRPAQADVARFAIKLTRGVERALHSKWRPLQDLQRELLDAVITGYSSVNQGDVTSRYGRLLTTSYLAAEALAKTIGELRRDSPSYDIVVKELTRGLRLSLRTLTRRPALHVAPETQV
jgi:hypothetical protein